MFFKIRSVLSAIGIYLIIHFSYYKKSNLDKFALIAIFPTLGAVAIIAGGNIGFINEYLLSNRVSRYIGSISYTWYLWHWPAIILAPMYGYGRNECIYLSFFAAMLTTAVL